MSSTEVALILEYRKYHHWFQAHIKLFQTIPAALQPLWMRTDIEATLLFFWILRCYLYVFLKISFSPPTCLLPEKIVFLVKYWEIRNLLNGKTELRRQIWLAQRFKTGSLNQWGMQLQTLLFALLPCEEYHCFCQSVIPNCSWAGLFESRKIYSIKTSKGNGNLNMSRTWEPSVCKDRILWMHWEMWHSYSNFMAIRRTGL